MSDDFGLTELVVSTTCHKFSEVTGGNIFLFFFGYHYFYFTTFVAIYFYFKRIFYKYMSRLISVFIYKTSVEYMHLDAMYGWPHYFFRPFWPIKHMPSHLTHCFQQNWVQLWVHVCIRDFPSRLSLWSYFNFIYFSWASLCSFLTSFFLIYKWSYLYW